MCFLPEELFVKNLWAIFGRNINNLRYAEDIILMAESEEESERGEWKSWLKTQHSEN